MLILPLGLLPVAEPSIALPAAEIAETIHTHHLRRPAAHWVLERIVLAPPSSSPAEAVNRYLRTLDPYSRYLTAEAYPRNRREEGPSPVIGAELVERKDGIMLIPYKDGPLERAGVSSPKYLLRIDSHSLSELTLSVVGARIAAAKGTLKLELADTPQGPGMEVEVVKNRFIPSSVEVIRQDSANILRIRAFKTRETTSFVAAAVARLAAEKRPLIIDLRYCTGGDLYEAIDTASLFLGRGEIIAATIDADGKKEVYRSHTKAPMNPSLIPILVGPDTASAAEVFAAALRHYLRALLIGRETYGKTLSQGVYELTDGSALVLTNLVILKPGEGEAAEGQSLSPDIVVENATLGGLEALVQVATDALRQGVGILCNDHAQAGEQALAITAKAIQLSMSPAQKRQRLIKRTRRVGDEMELSLCIGPLFGRREAENLLDEYRDKLSPMAFEIVPLP